MDKKPSVILLVILAAVLVISAVITPFVQILIDLAIDTFPAVKKVSNFDFDRVMSRVLLVVALLLLYIYRKRLRITDIFRNSFPRNGKLFGEFGTGFLLGCLSLVVLIGITVIIGERTIDCSGLFSSRAFNVFIQAVMSALVVALIEEVFFRGFILQTLLNDCRKIWAVLFTSFFYSIVHFTKVEDHPHFAKLDLLAGFKTLGLMVEPLFNFSAIASQSIGLFIVGVILAYCYIWSKGLYLPIGLHAGWIFILKIDTLFVKVNQGWAYEIYGTDKIVDGYLSWVILSAVLVLIAVIYKFKRKAEIKS